MEASWDILGISWGILEASWAILGHLGVSWRHVWEEVGASWGQVDGKLGKMNENGGQGSPIWPKMEVKKAQDAQIPLTTGRAATTRTVVRTKNLQNLQGLARDLQGIYHSCTHHKGGAPDPVALRAIPATVPTSASQDPVPLPKSTKLGPQIHQAGLQNPPSWAPKSRKISLGKTLEGSWCLLGPRWPQVLPQTPPKIDFY